MKTPSTLFLLLFSLLQTFAQADFNLRFWGRMGTSGYIDQPITQIDAGEVNTVALKTDGTVVAWGDNGDGQTNIPSGLSGVKAIAAGSVHSVALKTDGTVVAWGGNSVGQSTIPSGLSGVQAIAVGGRHTVALKTDGTVVAWGLNSDGQTNIPSGLSGVQAIAAGSVHTVALKTDGTVVAWGNNSFGQTTIPSGLTGVKAIAAGEGHTVALKTDGTVVAWGSNSSGQSTIPSGLSGVKAVAAGSVHTLALKTDGTVVAWGNNTSAQTNIPSGLSGVKAITAGWNHNVALKTDGTVVAWGDNNHGQTTIPSGLSGVKAIAAGEGHTVALKTDGTVVAWGKNIEGQTTVPSGLSGIKAIATGGEHTFALKTDGTVVAWGHNGFGQISIPSSLSGVQAVAGGKYHSVALKTDGTVVAWGYNWYGQTNIPLGLSGVKAIAAGGYHSVALKTDGTVVAWGYDVFGQTTIPSGLSGVKAIAAGEDHTVALKVDGTVVAWGDNSGGQTTIPTGLSGVKAIAAGKYHTLALKTDGTVVAWGDYRQIIFASGLSGVKAIAAGSFFTVALLGSPGLAGSFSGQVFADSIANCKPDALEKGLPRFTLRAAHGSDTLYSGTDNYGNYYFDNLDSGKTYKFTALRANKNYGILSSTSCDTTFTLVAGKNDSTGFDIGYKTKYCPALKATVQATRRRRCFRNITKVTYTNEGLVEAKNAVLKVAFPKYVKPIKSDLAWSNKQDSLLTFNLGTVKALEQKVITITDSVVCGIEAIRGLTQCTKAWFTKANPCKDTLSSWDKSSVALSGSCFENGYFRFVVRNVGTGNMADSTNFRVFNNGTKVFNGKLKLTAGDSTEILIPSYAVACRLEVDQRAGHPGESSPSFTLNECQEQAGTFKRLPDAEAFSFPQDDADAEVAIDCQPIRDSYDPNDKQVHPSGWGLANYTKPNVRLKYTIRFQNTGTDTAFKVVVVDTLDKDLDITSLEFEGSSHTYLSRISGKNQTVLTFTFYNILLPDSTTDRVGSNGFIQYSIQAKTNIAKGTPVTNRAAIYFDFNSPIITNTTSSTMQDTVLTDFSLIKGIVKTANGFKLVPTLTSSEENLSHYGFTLYPNPAQGVLNISSSSTQKQYRITDLTGKTLLEGQLEQSGNGSIDIQTLTKGVYLISLGNAWKRFGVE